MTNAIKARDVCFSYKSGTVLNGLTFDVNEGSFFIIIGPNGSGKTTLMNVLCGIAQPHKGEVSICGSPRRSYSRKSLARTVALVPQLTARDFPFTVQEVVLMGRSPHLGMFGLERSDDLRCARQAMEFAGVDSLARRTIDQLSGGELQLVSIARAVCQEPRLMLLDEPTASLDFAHQIRIMDLMEQLKNDRGITVVMVSHDVNLAGMYGDCVLMLNLGRIVTMGPPGQVLTPEKMERVYGRPVLIEKSPLGGSIRVTPIPGKYLSTYKGSRI